MFKQMLWRAGAFGAALALAACGGRSPAAPSSTTSGTASAGTFVTTGRLTDVVSGAGVAGVIATSTDPRAPSTSATDATGAFSLSVDQSGATALPFTFTGASIVTRQTFIRVPGNAANVTAIPRAFDLTSFDEMCRVTMLTRWTSAPPLVIQTQTLQFTGPSDSAFPALAEGMTSADLASLSADLLWALPQLSGGTFTAFQSQTAAAAPAGSTATMMVSGQITVGRFAGLRAAIGSAGISRWLYQPDGTVIGGLIMLDRDFDRSGDALVRIVRAHELGHTMGFNHVISRTSIMNATPTIVPNAADLTAARVAFLRPPGNKSPDTDPSGYTLNGLRASSVGAVWTDPIR